MARPFNQIPLAENSRLITGHLHTMREDRLGSMRRLADLQMPLVRMRFFTNSAVLVNSPELLYEVLVGQAKRFEKSPLLRTALYPLAGDGLFTSEGELWRRQRKLMAPIFRFKGLRGFASDMAGCAQAGISTWQDGAVLDIARETTRIAMSVAGKTLFDADTFSEADAVGAALTTALEWTNDRMSEVLGIAQASLKIALLRAGHALPERWSPWCFQAAERLHPPLMLPGRTTRELRSALSVLEDQVDRMITQRLSSPDLGDDLLARLLAARDEDDGEAMSRKQVRDEILTLFIAGHETTASGLAWSLYLLARHPEIYAAAQAEADALGEGPVSFDDLESLPLALKVFKEALRMYPPIYLFARMCTEPVEIGGFHAPRGKIFMVCPYAMHYRADHWPDPDRFDPERFTPEAEAARPREAYLPFSGGPRTCIGNHFALMEGPIVLATLLRAARFEYVGQGPVTPEAHATLRPEGGVPMRVHLRSEWAGRGVESVQPA